MTDADVQAAIGQALAAVSVLPAIVWPNKDATPALPYLVFDPVPVGRISRTLAGASETASGYVLVTVVSKQNEFATIAQAIAQTIVNAFPRGLRITTTGGKVLINQPTRIMQAYDDGTHWRTPVRVEYLTE